MIELTIDGQKIEAEQGQTILEAAQANNIHIPTLCNHPDLKPSGSCRVCVVDVGRPDRLEAACTTPISKNMKIETNNQRVKDSRKVIIELLIDNLNIEPESLEKDGENILLDLAEELGVEQDREPLIERDRPRQPEDTRNPVIIREPDKCILCGRCVTACNELKHYGVLNYEGRGYDTSIVAGHSQSLMKGGCASCGACVEVCPTGAFTPLAKELLDVLQENVTTTGNVYQISRRTEKQREDLGLPPLSEAPIEELKKIIEKSKGGDEK